MQQVLSPLCPLIAFLTDFGLRDGYVGVLKGVVLSIVPQAQLIDITHDIPPQDIAAGAWVLGTSYCYFPRGTIYICVIDPGVGSARQPIAVHAGNWFFVGPDNGLLSYVLAEQPIYEAVALSNSTYHFPQVSATFHGRDVFAPVAAHIAHGVTLGDLGTPLHPSSLKRLDLEYANRQDGQITAQIVYIDHFGNLITDLRLPSRLLQSSHVRLGRQKIACHAETYAQVKTGIPFLLVGSTGLLEIACRNESAAANLRTTTGQPLRLYVD